jgi:hypothetical protein
MTIHLYSSEKRIKDILFQMDPQYLNEVGKKMDKQLSMKGEIKGGLPHWLQFLGFGGGGTLGAEGKIGIVEEIKPQSLEHAILGILKKVILPGQFYLMDKDTLFANYSDFNKKIIRAKGYFKMCVEGDSGLERLAKYDAMKYVEWTGAFTDFQLKFGTTPKNYIAPTAIFQCLCFPDTSAEIDFFGVVTRVTTGNGQTVIEALPLFFGIEIDF